MDTIAQLKEFMITMEKQGLATGSVTKQTITALEKAGRVTADDPRKPSAEDFCQNERVKDIFSRFLTKFSGELKPDSAAVYISRVVKAAENFCRYQKDPLGFQPSFSKVEVRTNKERKKKDAGNHNEAVKPVAATQAAGTEQASGDRFTTVFPLRKNLLLNLNLPNDLKTDEVKRMAYYLLTLCDDFSPSTTVWPQGAPPAVSALTNAAL